MTSTVEKEDKPKSTRKTVSKMKYQGYQRLQRDREDKGRTLAVKI